MSKSLYFDDKINDKLNENINIAFSALENIGPFLEKYSQRIQSIYSAENLNTVLNLSEKILIQYQDVINRSFDYSKIADSISTAVQKYLDSTFVQKEQQTEIEFTSEQINFLENELEIDLEQYSNKMDDSNNKRNFTKSGIKDFLETLLAIIGIIISIVGMYSSDKQAKETSEQLNQIIEIQEESKLSAEQFYIQSEEKIDQLTKQQEKTNELLEAILEQLTENDDDN